MRRSLTVALLVSCASTFASAQGASPVNYGNRSIFNAALSPNPAILPNAKSPATVTLSFSFYGNAYQGDCTYAVSWGDGSAPLSGNSSLQTGLGSSRTYTHAYGKTGQYAVEVKGTGTTGCTAPAYFMLTVQSPPPTTQQSVIASKVAPPAAPAAQVAAQAAAQAAAKARADSAAKAAQRAAEQAKKGPPPVNVDSLIRVAQLALEQRQRDVKAAQARLDSAYTSARDWHAAFVRTDSSRAACVASNPTRTGFAAMMTLDGYCKMQVGWFRAFDTDTATNAAVGRRKHELDMANDAVRKAEDDLAKARATPRHP